MKIYLSKTAGFCMGVNRAISKAEELSEKGGEIYTYGPLIHNPQVIEDLRKQNINVTNSLKGLKEASLIIRTHGVSPEEKEEILNSVKSVCDLTCPRVARVQGIIKKYAKKGYKIAIIGDSRHPEVKGLMGYAGNKGYVINKAADVKRLPKRSKLCIVSQTTMDKKIFAELSAILKQQFKDFIVFNTICDSTSSRQSEVLDLCKKTEAMIVIGGKNSANTARLAEISRRAGVKAYHVETEKELDLREIGKFSSVGVTAGASTPDWMIKRVLDKLKSYKSSKLFRLSQ